MPVLLPMKELWDKIKEWLSDDIGIDLGTANTLVYVKGRGIVINEPSMVAVNKKTGQVVAIGKDAKEMLGRTPGHVRAVQPLIDGVISDFEVTEEMLTYLINKAQGGSFKLLGPRVVVGIPSGITGVETRAVRDAAMNAGAREVHIVEEPMAAAIGIGLPVHDPAGSMVIDIGGGTTDIGVIALGGMVNSRNIKVAGDRLNADIVAHIRNEFKILIGDKSAEDVKIAAGSVSGDAALETVVRGRDLVTGLPREIVVTDADVREAMHHSISQLVDITKEVLETTPPEIVSDIMQAGIYLAGGGALIRGLPEMLREMLGGVAVHVADDPLTAVVRGTGVILDDINAYRESLKEHENQLSPTTS